MSDGDDDVASTPAAPVRHSSGGSDAGACVDGSEENCPENSEELSSEQPNIKIENTDGPPRKKSKKNKRSSGHAISAVLAVPDEDRWPKVTFDLEDKSLGFELYGASDRLRIDEPLPKYNTDEFQECDLPEPPKPAPVQAAKTPAVKYRKFNKKTPKSARRNPDATGPSKTILKLEPKPVTLPETVFSEVGDYPEVPDHDRPQSYFRFIEKTAEELEDEVEYEIDEEDIRWLERMNSIRSNSSLTPVSTDDFELLMDRLEKECVFQHSNGSDSSHHDDEDEAICCICMDGDCENTNVILFCDMCNLPVHQECYGVPYIPEGQWLCRRCLQSPSQAVDCVFCPNKGGAFKQTVDGRWAHVVCAIWIPEVCFANTVFLEPIDNIKNIPPARWRLSCYICKQTRRGACIQCNKNNCYTAFHVTCAQQAGLSMRIDAARDASGAKLNVKKSAFCDVHAPCGGGDGPMAADADSPQDADREAFRERLRKVRRILAERRTIAPPVSVPTLPPERVADVANLVSVPERTQFFRKLMSYWLMKRRVRNGVPLIRRLQASQSTRKTSPVRNRAEEDDDEEDEDEVEKEPEVLKTPEPKKGRKRKVSLLQGEVEVVEKKKQKADVEEKAKKRKIDVEEKKKKPDVVEKKKKTDADGKLTVKPKMTAMVKEDYTVSQKIRQDLEKARLLCELGRKRERLKREGGKVDQDIFLKILRPVFVLAQELINKLFELDKDRIFHEPVDPDIVEDYLDVVKIPMDLSTMKKKNDSMSYSKLSDMSADYELMIQNCLIYNAKDTYYYKEGVRQRDIGRMYIRQTRRLLQEAGINENGCYLEERPPEFEATTEARLKAVDSLTANGDPGRSVETKIDDALTAEAILLLIPRSQKRAALLKHIHKDLRRLRCVLALRKRTPQKNKKTEQPAQYDEEEPVVEESFDGDNQRDENSESGEEPGEVEEVKEEPNVSSENREEISESLPQELSQVMEVDEDPYRFEDNEEEEVNARYVKVVVEPKIERSEEVTTVVTIPPPTPRRPRGRPRKVARGRGRGRRGRPPGLSRLQTNGGVELGANVNELTLDDTPDRSDDSNEFTSPSTDETPAVTNASTSQASAQGRKRGSGLKTSPRQRKLWEWLKPETNGTNGTPSKSSEPGKKALFAEVLGEINPELPKAEPKSTRWGFGRQNSCDSASSRNKPSFSTYRNSNSTEEDASRDGELEEAEEKDENEENDAGSSSDESTSLSGEDDAGNHDGLVEVVAAANGVSLNEEDRESGVDDLHSDHNSLEGAVEMDQVHPDLNLDSLKPNDLIWVRHYRRWFPGLFCDKDDPDVDLRTVSLPLRPHRKACELILVRMFDKERTWRWVDRDHLLPLGISSEVDKEKITEWHDQDGGIKVKNAYERAVQYYSTNAGREEEDEEATEES